MCPDSSAVHVPELDALDRRRRRLQRRPPVDVPGPTTTQSDGVDRRRSDEVERPSPEDDHRRTQRPRRTGQRRVAPPGTDTRQYIHDFDESVAECGSGDEVVARMTERYPTLGNPYTLWFAAHTQPYEEQRGDDR